MFKICHIHQKICLSQNFFCTVCISFKTQCIISVLGSDVIYSEGAVADLLATLMQLCGAQTTIVLAGELRNGNKIQFVVHCSYHANAQILILFALADSILEYFLEAAMKDFMVGRVDQTLWHPDYCSPRVVIYILVKKKSPTT